MGAVDTNVLIRCVVRDDLAQWHAVASLRSRYREAGQQLFVPVTVLLEFEWVLRSRFRFDKDKVLDAMAQVLDADDLLIDEEEAMDDALELFRYGEADLADCMHERIAAAAARSPLHTFDRRASALPAAELLRVGAGQPVIAALSSDQLDLTRLQRPQTDAPSPTDRPPPVAAPSMASRC